MPKSHAERQRDYRERQRATGRHQAERISDFEAALETERAILQTEVDTLRADLDTALAEVERLSATQCQHPAGALHGSRCHACNSDLW